MLFTYFKENKKRIFKDSLKQLGSLASYQFFIFISIFFLIFSFWKGIFLSSLFLISYIIIAALRIIFFKERPKKVEYSNIFEKIKASSFPSMHTIRGFLLLLFFSFLFKSFRIILYLGILFLIIIFSRIYFKKHFLNDILYGIIISTIIYFFILFLFYLFGFHF